MQLTATNNAQNLRRVGVSVQEAQQAAKTENVQKSSVETTTNTSTTTVRAQAQTDVFENSAYRATKDLVKRSALAYLVGFCFGFCPGLFVVAAGAFLFSNKGEGFREKLANAISGDSVALQRFQQQTTVTENKEQQPAQQTTELAVVTNPIEAQRAEAQEEKEEKPLTPLEMAQLKYAKAQEYQEKRALDLEKKEAAQRVAEEKLEHAQARLDKAQAEYDKANAAVKMQMTDRMTRLNESVATKQVNANLAKEKTDVARALLEEAGVKLEIAQRAFEDLQAEEIVDVM